MRESNDFQCFFMIATEVELITVASPYVESNLKLLRIAERFRPYKSSNVTVFCKAILVLSKIEMLVSTK